MTTSALAASSLAAPSTFAPAPGPPGAGPATADPFGAIREPIVTRLPALARRSVRPNPSSPVPPMIEMSMAGRAYPAPRWASPSPTSPSSRSGSAAWSRPSRRLAAGACGGSRSFSRSPAPRRSCTRSSSSRTSEAHRDGSLAGVVLAEHAAEHVGDLAESRPRAKGDLHGWKQVGGAAGHRLDLLERPVHRILIARGSERPEPLDLLRDLLPADRLDPDRLLLGILEPVHADDHAFSGLDPLLDPERGLGDLVLVEPGLDRLDRAPHLVDPLQVAPRAGLDLVRERLDVVRAPKGIHGMRHARLVPDHLL